MGPLGKLKSILQSQHVSVTRPRIRVFEILAASDAPISIRQIQAKAQDLDKVSIYRTIDLYEKIGVVTRVWNGFKSSIELSEAFSPHHHHFTCSQCGTVQTISSEPLEAIISDIEQQHNFTLSHHAIELHGLCAQCKFPADEAQ